MSGAVVCGFWDPESGAAGLGWDIAGSCGGLLLRDGVVAFARTAIETSGKSATLSLEANGGSAEAELKPRPAPSPLASQGFAAEGSVPEGASCRATVRLSGAGKLRCEGHLTRWASDPTGAAAVLRHMALPASEGGLLIALAARAPGAESHAGESSAAWLLETDGTIAEYPEALFSTQYDPQGLPTRAGLELWSASEDAPPMRAAGTSVDDGAPAPDGDRDVSAAIMRTSAEGFAGVGSYVIWRA